jgi:hypothetical protein
MKSDLNLFKMLPNLVVTAEIQKTLEEEAPFFAEEIAITLLLIEAWKPIQKKLRNQLSDFVDFKKGEYLGGVPDDYFFQGEGYTDLVKEQWAKAAKKVYPYLQQVYELPWDSDYQVQSIASVPDEDDRDYILGALMLLLGTHFTSYIDRLLGPTVIAKLEKASTESDKAVSTLAAVGVEREIAAEGYMATLSNIHAARSSHFGFLSWAVMNKVTAYTIYSFGDDRVCPVCQKMDGLTFTVEQAIEYRDQFVEDASSVSSAQDLEILKDRYPFPTKKDLEATTRDAIEKDGSWCMPPYHPACRCYLVTSTSYK